MRNRRPIRSRPHKPKRVLQRPQVKPQKVPASFRGPVLRPRVERVLEECALPTCKNQLDGDMRGDARHCCPEHRRKHWRMTQRAAADTKSQPQPVTPRVTVPPLAHNPQPVTPHVTVPPLVHTEAVTGGELEMEVAHMRDLLAVDPRDEDARARLQALLGG